MKLKKFFISTAFGLATVSFSCCNLDDSVYSKDNHLKTIEIKDSLYNEIFGIRSRFSDVERYSEYITDSVSFRKYVCTHDFGEWLYGEILKDDVLAVYKIVGSIQENQTVFDTIPIATYSINALKREGDLE